MRHAIFALAGLALVAAPASALTVQTAIAPDFQIKLEKDYGVREAGILSEALASKVEQRFSSFPNVDRVVVTILDAKPNRPTFQQVSDRPGLDPIRSISIGGAKVSGVAYDASGAQIGDMEYDWYETDIEQAVTATTWSDARWAFDRFARRFANTFG